jgi:hypothetical protein
MENFTNREWTKGELVAGTIAFVLAVTLLVIVL